MPKVYFDMPFFLFQRIVFLLFLSYLDRNVMNHALASVFQKQACQIIYV